MANTKRANRPESPEGSFVFENKESAKRFLENVERKAESRAEKSPEKAEAQNKEALKQALAEELKKYGPEPIETRKGEWQYTESDREEVQKYVNLAFATNLKKATDGLMNAKSDDQALQLRTIDLFHDTLVDHLYDEMLKRDMLPSKKTYSDVVILTLTILAAIAIAVIILIVAVLQ